MEEADKRRTVFSILFLVAQSPVFSFMRADGGVFFKSYMDERT